MTTSVSWVSYHQPEIIARNYWDQGVCERLLDRRLWRPPGAVTFEDIDPRESSGGGVVVLPARHHATNADVERLNTDLAVLDWCVLILTGDEEHVFPWRQLRHSNLALWIMTPGPDAPPGATFIGSGWHPDTPDVLALTSTQAQARPLHWSFAGQVTHEKRRECHRALSRLRSPGELVATGGFTQGKTRHEYLTMMAATRIAACPSGPVSADSMRAWEALEAGCLPLVDRSDPSGWDGYWPLVCGGEPPFPMVDRWSLVPKMLPDLLEQWPGNASRSFAWWQRHKRALSHKLERQVTEASERGTSTEPDDHITVLIPTSPIPSHPDTSIIEETIDSVRERLPLAEIVVMIDGIRPEQDGRTSDYAEYVRRLLWLTNHRWDNVVPLLAESFSHQCGLTRHALDDVVTSCVLFVEHDTPLVGEIPWASMVDAILTGQANTIRLHHEAIIPDSHRHLMLDESPTDVGGIPLLRTAQWSQRPHLSATSYYRRILTDYFGPGARTMIEDVMHGVIDYAHRERGEGGWEDHRLWIYAPERDMRRSANLDGRGDDPKYEMRFSYPGGTPEGAPRATSERVD